VLDVIENAVEAGASKIKVMIEENLETDTMVIEVLGDGRGMSQELVQRVLDPFYTTRKTRHVGLGLPLFAEACGRCEDNLTIKSEIGRGTEPLLGNDGKALTL
jgi:K+-sensing histidine kinase KdpD